MNDDTADQRNPLWSSWSAHPCPHPRQRPRAMPESPVRKRWNV